MSFACIVFSHAAVIFDMVIWLNFKTANPSGHLKSKEEKWTKLHLICPPACPGIRSQVLLESKCCKKNTNQQAKDAKDGIRVKVWNKEKCSKSMGKNLYWNIFY